MRRAPTPGTDAEVDSVVARAALDADRAVLDRFAEARGRAGSGVGGGVAEPVRVRRDAALLRAAAGTDANLATPAPGQLDVADGLGATLRYPTAAE